MWHLRGWGSDGIIGYSPVTLARKAVELGMSLDFSWDRPARLYETIYGEVKALRA